MQKWMAMALVAGLAGGALAAETMKVKNLKVLVPIYRGAPDDDNRMSDHDVLMARNGLELGRLFYFRNSRAQLNIEFDWLVIDTVAPETAGPTMDNIVADLHQRGIKDGEYDGLIATGVGLKGNWGGFNVLGGAGGCFGIGGKRSVGYPEFDEDTGYGWAWIFAHEFQHALDLVIVESSDLDMLHSHPYVDRVEEFFRGYYLGGEHWDWIAVTLREFDQYLQIKGVRNDFLEVVDADGDRLPDDDPRLPADERRFGSSPTAKDTDGDGLDDLGEFVANRHRGSDPTKADTDGDGLNDAEDRYPVIPIAPTLPYAVDDKIPDDAAPLLTGAFVRTDEGGDIAVYGAWTEDRLYLRFRGPREFRAIAKIDGSAANGFWEGGDTYVLRIDGAAVKFAGLGLRGDVPGARVSRITASGAASASALGQKVSAKTSTYELLVEIPAAIGQGVSKEINYGGTREPQDVAAGLTLVDGRSIGVNFIYEFTNGTQAVLTPHHTIFATRLVKPADAPDRPILRAPALTNDAVPVVEVLGVRPLTRVHVLTGGTSGDVVGARVGPGAVRLVELSADGTYDLVATTPDAASEPATITVDRTAPAPTLTVTGDKLLARCEPHAQFELWWGVDGSPVAPIDGALADESGRVELDLSGAHFTGWTVTAYRDMHFHEQAYITSWPKIDQFFRGGAPNPRLPADGFAFRCEGLLQISHDGRYTFELNTDDGSRLFIDNEVVLDHWGHHGMSPKTATVHLAEGLRRVRIDYYEENGWAGFKFRGGAAGGELTFDLPVVRVPLPADEVELYGVQCDRLGNRSDFSVGRAAVATDR